MSTTTREERAALKGQCTELADLLDGGWTQGQKDRCSLFLIAAKSGSIPLMRAVRAHWDGYTANTRRTYLATARYARERRGVTRQIETRKQTRLAESEPSLPNARLRRSFNPTIQRGNLRLIRPNDAPK